MKFREFFFGFCKFLLILAILFCAAVVGYYFALFRVHKAEKYGGSVLISRGIPFINRGNSYGRLTKDSDIDEFLNVRTNISVDYRTVSFAITPKYDIDELELHIELNDLYGQILESFIKSVGDVKKDETTFLDVRLSDNLANMGAVVATAVLSFQDGTVTY